MSLGEITVPDIDPASAPPKPINIRVNRALFDGPVSTGMFGRVFDTTVMLPVTAIIDGTNTLPNFALFGQTLYNDQVAPLTIHLPTVASVSQILTDNGVSIIPGRCIYFTVINTTGAGALTINSQPGGITDPNWSMISSQTLAATVPTVSPFSYVQPTATFRYFRIIYSDPITNLTFSDS